MNKTVVIVYFGAEHILSWVEGKAGGVDFNK